MRIALLSRDPSAPPVQREPLPGCNHDIRSFNIDPHRHPSEPQLGSYAEIAALYPRGWHPDVYLHWSLEYNPVPYGIEEADCMTVATVGDWNLGGQAFQALGGAFDLLIADRNGCDRLRQAGFENVCYVPLWGYDPNLHRTLPEVERDIDIVMVGNFNHEVQRERSRWLARVAKLSHRYHVCLTSNVYGEEYARLLNRAKIVFNRSIRGEINMRVYETLSCGALLFNESENAEIGQLLTDRVHCVLYDEHNLEDLLDYYLSHTEDRERIALAGRGRITPYTYDHIYRQIYAAVKAHSEETGTGEWRQPEGNRAAPEGGATGRSPLRGPRVKREQGRENECGVEGPARRPRQFASLSPAERESRYARQRLAMAHRRGLPGLAERFAQSLFPPSSPPAVSKSRSDSDTAGSEEAGCMRACAMAEWAVGLTDIAERRRQLQAAIACAHQALRQAPDHVVLRFNLAQMYLALDRAVAAMNELQKTLQLLSREEIRPDMLRGPLFPHRYDAFLVDLEAIYATYRPESPEWIVERSRLLRRRALEQCSDLASRSRHAVEALAYAEAAASLDPRYGANQRRTANALRALGRSAEAEAYYRRALEDIPLDPEVWSELATLLIEQERVADCWAFLEEINLLLDGCPAYDFWRPTLRALLSRLLPGRHASSAPARVAPDQRELPR